MLERLQKLISAAGIASRRAAEELILNGRVAVNGRVVTELGSKADPGQDRITVDGKPLVVAGRKLHILLNKPAGYMTTLDDPKGRPLVTDLLKGVEERVYPVGRLDYNTEGLLLLTNDGDWANRLMHPRHEVEKEYFVRVRGKAADQQVKLLADGVDLEEGRTAPARVRLVKSGEQNDWISITIHEGRNRQVRRMCEAVSLSVVRLRRVRYGSIGLGELKPGEFRFLSEAEVSELSGGKPKAPGTETKQRIQNAHDTKAFSHRAHRGTEKKGTTDKPKTGGSNTTEQRNNRESKTSHRKPGSSKR